MGKFFLNNNCMLFFLSIIYDTIIMGVSMKNNKGFTLIEISAVVVILSLLALLIAPIVSQIIKANSEKTYDDQISSIIASAKVWGTEHMNGLPGEMSSLQASEIISAAKQWSVGNNGELPDVGDSDIIITLATLQAEEFISTDLKNVSTGKEFDPLKTKIIISNNNGTISYTVIQEEVTITLDDLQKGGYADKDLKNPVTDELFDPMKTKIVITNNNNNLIYRVVIEE